MERSPNLDLPYIMPAQAQKHVTHNEAIQRLDAVVHLAVLAMDGSAPPETPAEGDRHIVADGATGDWAGHDGDIALWQSGAWTFLLPHEGWLAWVADGERLMVFSSARWLDAGGGSTGAMLGINATADETNRLAVASHATLFSHAGADHQLKLNKAASGDTASLLFQTGYSGRAEMGTAGHDGFSIKVSADGSGWREALVIDGASGRVSLPLTPGRELLAANRTYWVRTDGNDANDGRTDTPGGAFATIQKAIDTAFGLIDLGPHHVTIQLGTGIHVGAVSVLAPHVGSGTITLAGDSLDPAATLVRNTTSGRMAIEVSGGATLRIRDLSVESTGNSTRCLNATEGGSLFKRGHVRLGAGNAAHIGAQENALINAAGAQLTLYGNASRAFWCLLNSTMNIAGATIAVEGRSFNGAFIAVDRCSLVHATGMTFIGTASGRRFTAATNAVLHTGGQTHTYFPGDVEGTTATGGLYT